MIWDSIKHLTDGQSVVVETAAGECVSCVFYAHEKCFLAITSSAPHEPPAITRIMVDEIVAWCDAKAAKSAWTLQNIRAGNFTTQKH